MYFNIFVTISITAWAALIRVQYSCNINIRICPKFPHVSFSSQVRYFMLEKIQI
jgi:hypothetical protein